MPFVELCLLAVALSMDAFAVAVCAGVMGKVKIAHYARLCIAFGLFQAGMPIVGWAIGYTVLPFVEAWDHWVAFAFLAWVGCSMIYSCVTGETQTECHFTTGRQLIVLSVATSLDAMAVGLSLATLSVNIGLAALTIGLVCTIFSAFGVVLGRILAGAVAIGRWATLLGGVVLIGIGVHILFEHGVF